MYGHEKVRTDIEEYAYDQKVVPLLLLSHVLANELNFNQVKKMNNFKLFASNLKFNLNINSGQLMRFYTFKFTPSIKFSTFQIDCQSFKI